MPNIQNQLISNRQMHRKRTIQTFLSLKPRNNGTAARGGIQTAITAGYAIKIPARNESKRSRVPKVAKSRSIRIFINRAPDLSVYSNCHWIPSYTKNRPKKPSNNQRRTRCLGYIRSSPALHPPMSSVRTAMAKFKLSRAKNRELRRPRLDWSSQSRGSRSFSRGELRIPLYLHLVHALTHTRMPVPIFPCTHTRARGMERWDNGYLNARSFWTTSFCFWPRGLYRYHGSICCAAQGAVCISDKLLPGDEGILRERAHCMAGVPLVG